jgi:hypothetical protein
MYAVELPAKELLEHVMGCPSDVPEVCIPLFETRIERHDDYFLTT